jgi:hypothetical protein
MTAISNPSRYFQDLGSLHDAFIEAVKIDLSSNRLTLGIDNIDACLTNPPAAPKRPALLHFNQVSEVRLAFALMEGVRIGSLSIGGEADAYTLTISLSSGGIADDDATWWMSASFRSSEIDS